MKIFKKRKPLKNTSVQRIPFEHIITTVLDHYKDNIICSDETRKRIVHEISKEIRDQLPD